MNRIPTAEEFYKQITGCVINHVDIKKAMIEFAKLHLQAAQEAFVDKRLIKKSDLYYLKNVYPLENIK